MQLLSWKGSIIASALVIAVLFLFGKIFTVQNSPVSADFLVAHHSTMDYQVVHIGLEQDQIVGIDRSTGQQIMLIPSVQKAVGMRDPETLQLLGQPDKSDYIFFQEIKYVGGILAGDNISGGSNANIQHGYIWKYDKLSNSFSKLRAINSFFEPEYSSGAQLFISPDQGYAIIVPSQGNRLIAADLQNDKFSILGDAADQQSFLDAPSSAGGRASITWLNPTVITCGIYDSSSGNNAKNKRALLGVQTVPVKR